jgi:hypothetical protein
MMPDTIRAVVEKALCPGCFFVAAPLQLRVEHAAREQVPWELFRGHLLDPAHARESADFETWNVFVEAEAAACTSPLISIRWQPALQRLFVVRQILTHGFEAYEDAPGVILTRPVHKWVAELVGTIAIDGLKPQDLAAELANDVFLAVIGNSRLPITSLESPLPAFSLGQFGYLPRLSDVDRAQLDPVAFFESAVSADRSEIEQAKALELAMRAVGSADVPRLVDVLKRLIRMHPENPDRVPALFRTVFNTVALSPYTGFVDTLIAVLGELAVFETLGAARIVDLVSTMLRHLCRHLTAFDLTLFHSFGANYPDALFLDALLKAYLRLVETHPELFTSTDTELTPLPRNRLRRRALRQAFLLRKQYEGQRVPDAPTSMGENVRVLPAPFERVPEEQIVQVGKRRRVLYEGNPLEGLLSETARRVHRESLADLAHSEELCELGMASFLDRPLGAFKPPGEIDRTPLVSYEAFSRSVVKRRLALLKSAGWISKELQEEYVARLDAEPPRGVPVASLAPVERPGVVSLADALKVAADFVLLRTTRQSRRDFLAAYDLIGLENVSPESAAALDAVPLIVLAQNPLPDGSLGQPTLRGYDGQGRLRIELGFGLGRDQLPCYSERGGVERVVNLQVLRVWDPDSAATPIEFDCRDKAIRLKLR